jgi:hypothetical protein
MRACARAGPGPGLAEGFVVLGLFGLWTLFVLVTYSRVPANELYNVSETGLRGGLSRVLVFLGWPTALAAIAVLAITLDRFLASGRNRRAAIGLALIAFALCATIVIPGVVDEADLDAKPSNGRAAAGVVLVVVLAIWAAGTIGTGGATARRRGDRARVLVAAVLLLVSLPWVFADVGIFLGDIPPLGHVYRSEQIWTSREGERLPSVHFGHHHGMGGMLLVVTALLLSRELVRMRPTSLRTTLAVYLSLLMAYGVGNIANDAWYEQVVKRNWTDWAIPDVIRPGLTWMWGLIIVVGTGIFFLLDRDVRGRAARSPPF